MVDKMVMQLGSRVALGADDNQWLLLTAAGKAGRWKAVGFVRSSKQIVLRLIRERGLELSEEGGAALEALPETFTEWQRL